MRVAVLTAVFVLQSFLFAPKGISPEEQRGNDSGSIPQITEAQKLLEQTIKEQRQLSTYMAKLAEALSKTPRAETLAAAREQIETINNERQTIVAAVTNLQTQLRALQENLNHAEAAGRALEATRNIQAAQVQARSRYAGQMLTAALDNLSAANPNAAQARFNDALQQEGQIQRALEGALPCLVDAVKVMKAPIASSPARAGAITGQLRTTSGEPVANLRVVALTADTCFATKTIMSLAATDQNGRYELKDIPPGTYLVAAGPLNALQYFPGVAASSEATIVTVTSGVTATEIDFSLR